MRESVCVCMRVVERERGMQRDIESGNVKYQTRK